MSEKLQQILSLVDEYITDKHSKKTWNPGIDWVQYAGPFYSSEEYIRAVKTLLGEWLVLGDEALKFEVKFPKLLGKQYGILTNSGSSSNLLMMQALKSKKGHSFKDGTKVVVPAAGFPTTINPILQSNFQAVFVDIELDTLNIDVDHLERVLSADPDIKIITFAHVLGNPPNMNRVMELVDKYNLIFLEDTCDALGSTYDGKKLGEFGLMSSVSFYPAHHITMGEGGFVATNDWNLNLILRSFREWGRGCYCVGKQANLLKDGTCKCRFSNWLPSLPNEIFDHKYVYDEIGYNMKPIELQASLGLVQMEKIDTIKIKRKINYNLLLNIFKKYEQFFHLPYAQNLSDPSWFAFPLTIRDGSPFKRSDICQFLENNKIQTRPYFAGNILLQPAYKEYTGEADVKSWFPVATKATTDTFFLGTSPVITPEQIAYIEVIVDTFMSKL